jgi:hypothetical protein
MPLAPTVRNAARPTRFSSPFHCLSAYCEITHNQQTGLPIVKFVASDPPAFQSERSLGHFSQIKVTQDTLHLSLQRVFYVP